MPLPSKHQGFIRWRRWLSPLADRRAVEICSPYRWQMGWVRNRAKKPVEVGNSSTIVYHRFQKHPNGGAGFLNHQQYGINLCLSLSLSFFRSFFLSFFLSLPLSLSLSLYIYIFIYIYTGVAKPLGTRSVNDPFQFL